jgi:CheY-like chemotaxis protein/anti-sigma regulatory factor (Ser/Thr protein kinase)
MSPASPPAPSTATPTLDLAELAHELRNVLSAIAGRVELLRVDASPEAVRRGLDAIGRAADDAAALVRRLEADAPLPAPAPLDLRALLDDVAARAEVRATRPLQLRVSGEPAPAIGDATALRQVLTNLAYNAVDALPAGGRLELRAGRTADGVFVEVRDDGPGIDAATQARIFEPRFTTKGARGRGLGLGIAEALTRRAGGRLELESSPGAGTCFRLRLPAHDPAPLTPPIGPPAAAPPQKTRAKAGFGRMLPHVLVVDDEPAVREVLADMLRTQDYTVDEVDGGRAAIERFVQFRYDLVFTDLGMPDMNGWEVAAALKAARPEVPVVIVTGWDTQGSARAAGATGDVEPLIEARAAAPRSSADAVIAKPFRLGELVPLAARLVGASSR